MTYLYHRVPEKKKGEILYPLNILKKKNPEAYKYELKKYSGREELTKKKIPILNCLWNDVLHLSPIPPSKIKRALKEAGFRVKKAKWYKINVNDLEKSKTVFYIYKKGKITSKKNFKRYDPSEVLKYKKIPKTTLDYYKEKRRKKEKPMMFFAAPHILYKGILNISKSPIIEV